MTRRLAFRHHREQRRQRTGEVAEFFVLPVEEALENLHRQRFAGGEDGAQRRAHVFAELLRVGELPLEVLAEDSAESLRELFRAIEREMAVPNVVAEAFDVEEHAFALFQNLLDEAVGVRAVVEWRPQFAAEVVAEVGAVGFGLGVEQERIQCLQRSLDVELRPAGDDEAEPVGQARGVPREHFHQRVAPGLAGFVEGVNHDQIPLAAAVDDRAQRVGEEVVEQFRRVLPVQFGDLRQGQQELAVIGQPGGELEGEAADDARRVAVVGLVPFAELGGDDGVARGVGQLGGEGALADAGRAHDPEEARVPRSVSCRHFSTASNSHRASVEAFAQQLADAGLGLDGFEMAVERFDLTGKAAAFVALHDADDLGELGLIPLLPRRLARGAPLFPVVHVEPLDVADVHRRLHLLLALDEDGLDVAALHADGDGDLIAADAGVAGGMLREEGDELVAARRCRR